MRLRKMTEIDLHGFKHDEVEDKLANLLILHYNMGNFPIRLITGKSDKMKTIVRGIVKEHGFTEDDFWNDNPGTIILRS
jgi:DNA-nicking Smr family endonuclease